MNEAIQQLEVEIYNLKAKLSELRRQRLPEPLTTDYTFQTKGGRMASLADLFGAKSDLLVIHNMGRSCSYCTLWADGFVSLLPHLESRAAFVVVSPDDAPTQAELAASRGWTFGMASSQGTTFTQDMGFASAEYGSMPGVSAFHKDAEGKITRTGSTFFGPGDDFCAVWPLFDLLANGANGWEPE